MTHREFEERNWPDSATDCEGTLRIDDRTGPIWVLACDRCSFVAGLPARDVDPSFRERARREVIERRRRASGIPAQLRGLSWERVAGGTRPNVLAAAKRLAAGEERGLLLSGAVGVGKTWLAAAAAWELLEREPLSWFFVPDLFNRLGRSFEDASRDDTLDRLGGSAALVLDDLDKARPTDYAAEQLLCAIDNRVTAGAPLIVTTNLDLNALADRFAFGHAIVDRLVGHCEAFALLGQSRRIERSFAS